MALASKSTSCSRSSTCRRRLTAAPATRAAEPRSGTTLGAERHFTRSLRLGAELGYHFGGTFTGACPMIYDPTAGPSYPNMTPGYALRLTATYGAE